MREVCSSQGLAESQDMQQAKEGEAAVTPEYEHHKWGDAMSRQDPGAQSRGPFTLLTAVIFCLEEGLVPSVLPMCFSSS